MIFFKTWVLKMSISIENDIKKFNFDDDIIREANKIHESMISFVSRGKKRKQKILFVIYNAHLNLGRVYDIHIIAKKMDIKQKKVSKIFTLCSPIKTGYNYRKMRFKPVDYVKLYMDHLEILNQQQKIQILSLSNTIISKNESITSYPPQKLAASLIIYYAKINGYQEISDQMKELFYRPHGTLDTIVKKIGDIHNQ